jgi:hypothetical protein
VKSLLSDSSADDSPTTGIATPESQPTNTNQPGGHHSSEAIGLHYNSSTEAKIKDDNTRRISLVACTSSSPSAEMSSNGVDAVIQPSISWPYNKACIEQYDKAMNDDGFEESMLLCSLVDPRVKSQPEGTKLL